MMKEVLSSADVTGKNTLARLQVLVPAYKQMIFRDAPSVSQ